MKNDLISRSALIEAFHTDIVNHMQYIDDSTVSVCIAEIEEAPTAAAAPEWISVKDGLPVKDDADENEYVYLYSENMKQCAFGLWNLVKGDRNVTHWMPLPNSPKEEQK